MNTYEMIKALPGKGTNWRSLVDALSANYVAVYTAAKGQAPWAPTSTDEWAAAKGIRQLREAAWHAAGWAVQAHAQRSRFLPPSEETLSWGGFLGGETVVWSDDDAEAEALDAVRQIIERTA